MNSTTGPTSEIAERTQRQAWWVRSGLLIIAILLMLPGAWRHSITVVELAQLPAGLAAWQSHSLEIYCVCGPVSKWLYALPAYLVGVHVETPANSVSEARGRQEWGLGKQFQAQHPGTCQAIYRWSRILPILVTLLGGCLICEWSTRLFGLWPGIVSLAVWCGMVPVLAHGSLVTSDMPSAVMAVLAARTFWTLLIRSSVSSMLMAGVALGLAQATKFTLLILDPCWVMLLAFRALQTRRARPCVLSIGMLFTSLVVIDACYGLRGIGFTLLEWRSAQSSLARAIQDLAQSPTTSWMLRVPLPIPIELLRGLDVQLADTERIQSAYLMGQSKLGGWWYWYAAASLIKVPLPALILYGMAALRIPKALRSNDAIFWAGLCMLVPAMEIFLTISATTGTGTNAAFRYLLPSLGLMSVWVGAASKDCSRIRGWIIAGLIGWHLVDAVVAVPDHLGWRNEIGWAAERRTGKPPLIGDSLDWGQDLALLGDWISRHESHGSTVVCVYGLGMGEPYGLKSPVARSTSNGWPGAAFLAVSDNIVYGYEPGVCVSIDDGHSALSPEQCETLQRIEPYDRVGRTIRIYRLIDLPANVFLIENR